MGFFGAILGAFGQALPTLALDTLSALINAPPPTNAKNLANKSFESDAYGHAFPRARGTVRLQGKVIYASPIRASVWKTTAGGLFGIGQKSVRYNKYSASLFVSFGKKVNLGAASMFLRLWADGKLLYDGLSSSTTISGAITVTVVVGGQIPGSLSVLVDVASGATLILPAGALISFPQQPNMAYEVQQPVNVTGPATNVPISIWPPLQVNLPGGGQITAAGINGGSPWDLSSFDPDPHDRSHFDSGYLAPNGGATFYLGGQTTPDPTMVKDLGTGNVPVYQNLVGVMLHDLELINYGNHIPQITAEIAFDTAAAAFPMNGPMANVTLAGAGLGEDSIAFPFSGNEALQWTDPLTQRLPYLFIFSNFGQDATHDGTIYRINVNTNTVESSTLITRVGTFRLTGAGMIADNDGYLYFVQNNSLLTKFDGLAMQAAGSWSGGHTYTFMGQNVGTLYAWDTQQNLLGNPIQLKLLIAIFGLTIFNFYIFDRNVLLPLGVPNPSDPNAISVVMGYDTKGNPIIVQGDAITFSLPTDPGNADITDDGAGNLWFTNGPLYQMNCQFQSSILIDSNGVPHPFLAPPSLVTSSVLAGSWGSCQYYPGDDSIVVFSSASGGTVAKYSIPFGVTLTLTGLGISGNATKISSTFDPMGTLLVSGGSGFVRIDLASLTQLSNYNPASWPAAPVSGSSWIYDPYTDSAWFDGNNGSGGNGALDQALLDRGTGGGVGLDSIVSSLMLEAGYSSGQFDVTLLTTQGLTVFGVEFERESYADSLKRLMQVYLFDAAEIDGVIKFVPRGQAPSVIPTIGSSTIPESDLGALEDPTKYEPRMDEIVEDPLDTPESVWIKYFDPLRECQQATQYAKRISQPYPSTIVGGKNVTNSRQKLDIVAPITENATPIQNQADKILWDAWTGRFQRKFKLPLKYIQLDPTDVVLVNYKGVSLEIRIEEADLGAGFAIQISGRSQDESVYSSTPPFSANPGTGSAQPPTTQPAGNGNYTINPLQPLTSPNSTTVDLAAVVASFTSGLRTSYAARTFTVPDPGAGHSQIYFVTIADPNFTGDQPPGTASLTAYCQTTAAAAFVGQPGYIYMGAITVIGGGNPGVPEGTGGQPNPPTGTLVAEIAFGPTTHGLFKIAHNLGYPPSDVQIQVVHSQYPSYPTGDVQLAGIRYDASYVYLWASDDGLNGYLEIFG